MKNNLFDNFVSEKLSGYKPEVPSHIWDNIAAKNGDKKPPVFWLSALGKAAAIFLLLSLLGGAGYYFTKNGKSTKQGVVKKETTQPLNNVALENNTTATNEQDIIPTKKLENNAIEPIQPNQTKNDIVKIKETKNEVQASSYNKKVNVKQQTKVAITPSEIENDRNELVFGNALSIKPVTMEKKLISDFSLNKASLIKTNIPIKLFIPCPEAEKDAAGNKKYIEAYAGPDYTFNDYEDTGFAYIEKRKSSTALNFAYSAGLRYTKVFSNGISMRVGLNYSHINEKFFAKNGYEISRVFSINSVGDTTSNYLLSTPKYEKSTNTYNSIDIPVQMGYELGNGRFHVNISAGASINIVSKQKGSVIVENGLAANISASTTKADYKYKTNAGVSFLGSASVYYKVNESLHLMLEPYIRYSLSPITKSEITFKQKTHTAGLRIGIRKDL
jgi:hypothetical protein